MALLEGNEVEKKIGDYGAVILDVTPDLKVKLQVEANIDLIAELDKLFAKTSTPIDENVFSVVKQLLAAAALIK